MNGLDNEWESRIYELTPETQVVEVCMEVSYVHLCTTSFRANVEMEFWKCFFITLENIPLVMR
jgi:hypothetical protein